MRVLVFLFTLFGFSLSAFAESGPEFFARQDAEHRAHRALHNAEQMYQHYGSGYNNEFGQAADDARDAYRDTQRSGW